jgi:hypothetical protein
MVVMPSEYKFTNLLSTICAKRHKRKTPTPKIEDARPVTVVRARTAQRINKRAGRAKCPRIRRSIGVAKVRNCVEPDNGARFDRGRAMLVAIDNASRRGRYRIEPESIEVVS